MTGASDFAFSVEVGYRMYMVQAGRLHGFLQPGIFLNRVGRASRIAASAGIGAEYVLLEHMTIAAATGLSFQIGNLGGPAGSDVDVKIATGTTSLAINFYFP